MQRVTIVSLFILSLSCLGAAAQPYFPDTNLDGRIDLVDGNVLANNFGYTGHFGPSEGDFNNSGTVDATDFNILAGNYGRRLAGLPPPAQETIALYTGLTVRSANWEIVQVPISPSAIANDPQLADAKSYDVMISTLYPFTAAGLDITLGSGTFYVNPLRTNWYSTRATDEAIMANPSLAYDTCVGTKEAGFSNSDFVQTAAIGLFPAIPGNGLRGDTRLSTSWVQMGSAKTGVFSIARLTVLGSSVPPTIPEPSCLAPLLALAGLKRSARSTSPAKQ